jgi:hypothetical protein
MYASHAAAIAMVCARSVVVSVVVCGRGGSHKTFCRGTICRTMAVVMRARPPGWCLSFTISTNEYALVVLWLLIKHVLPFGRAV